MALYVFLFVGCLLLSLALLWRLDWLRFRLSSSPEGARRGTLPRLLKPRCPDDCPACRLASTPASARGPAPALVRPWCEVKSRRGAPKRVNTEWNSPAFLETRNMRANPSIMQQQLG
jgi:hypothetical protein